MKRIFLLVPLCVSLIYTRAQSYRVGINTTTPQAGLHVLDSTVLFSAAGAVSSTTNLFPPATGPGRRMMWWPGKAAFRVGYVNNNQWDKDSVGIYSFAAGYGISAAGIASIATGFNTKAVASYSTAMGYYSYATGLYSVALGGGALANANYSVAMGAATKASGFASTAIGILTEASGAYSTACGYNTTASGYYTFASGVNGEARGQSSTVMGQESFANATAATAIGYQDTATGNASVAIGTGLYARSYGEAVTGLYNTDYSAEGPDGISGNDRAFSVGIGTGTTDRKNGLTVMKNGRVGIGTTTPFSQLSNTSSNIIGTDNSGGNSGSFAWLANQDGYAAQIHNAGNYGNSNGLAVKVTNTGARALDISLGPVAAAGVPLFNVNGNGNVGIGMAYPAVKLDIAAGNTPNCMRISSGRGLPDNNGILIIQDSSSNNAGGTNNELVEFVNAQSVIIGTISRNANANSISFNTTSDVRLKTGIHPTRYGLQDLMAIEVADYRYKDTKNAASQTGFLAQQLYKVYPEAVTKGDDANEKQPYMVDYGKLTPLLVKAVQEMNARVDVLEKENQALRAANKRISDLAAQLKELQQLVKALPQSSAETTGVAR